MTQIAALRPNAPGVDTLLEAYGEAEAAAEREHPGLRYPDIIARSVIDAGSAHGIDVPEELATEVGNSVPDWPPFPDSPEALQRLKQRYRLIILSNVDRQSFAESNRRLGVEFDAVLTAEDIGSYKPDPRNFAALVATAEEMGIAKHRLLHVAQSLFHDHVPAQAAGLATAWIDRRSGKPGAGATPLPDNAPTPNWRFTSLAGLADAVEREG